PAAGHEGEERLGVGDAVGNVLAVEGGDQRLSTLAGGDDEIVEVVTVDVTDRDVDAVWEYARQDVPELSDEVAAGVEEADRRRPVAAGSDRDIRGAVRVQVAHCEADALAGRAAERVKGALGLERPVLVHADRRLRAAGPHGHRLEELGSGQGGRRDERAMV